MCTKDTINLQTVPCGRGPVQQSLVEQNREPRQPLAPAASRQDRPSTAPRDRLPWVVCNKTQALGAFQGDTFFGVQFHRADTAIERTMPNTRCPPDGSRRVPCCCHSSTTPTIPHFQKCCARIGRLKALIAASEICCCLADAWNDPFSASRSAH